MATRHRNLRADEVDWRPAKERAAREGTNMSEVIRASLRAYAAGLLDDILAPFMGEPAGCDDSPPVGLGGQGPPHGPGGGPGHTREDP